VAKLEALARESGQLTESNLFEIEKFQQIDRSAKSLKSAASADPSRMR
jgi:hypothetical protein